MTRQRLTYSLIAVFLWVCASHAQNPPLPSPLTAPEPATVGEVYRLTPVGALEALERVKLKEKKAGPPHRAGIFQPAVQSYTMYIEGAASSVVFKPGEAQVLAVRFLAPGDRWGQETTVEAVQRHLLLTRLAVQDGKRFITKVNVPVDVRSYGHPTPGLDSKQTNRPAASFQLIPRQTLPPGEYVVYMAGTHNGELVKNFLVGQERFAFAVAGP